MLNLSEGVWINKPKECHVSETDIALTTDPNTDFWQRSYYGFQNENAPAYLWSTRENFSFTTRVEFQYRERFDQAGVIIFLDQQNWFKASIEFEQGDLNRLGSVVTNAGHSDWATTDISTVTRMWYRLSRRGPDFLIESSVDGEQFKQMRIFHLQALGDTTVGMGHAQPPLPAKSDVKFGVYACSPGESQFTATFSQMTLQPSQWLSHFSD